MAGAEWGALICALTLMILVRVRQSHCLLCASLHIAPIHARFKGKCEQEQN